MGEKLQNLKPREAKPFTRMAKWKIRFQRFALSFRLLSIQFLGGVLMVGLLTGCAFSRTPVQVKLVPSLDRPLKEPVKASVKVIAVRDTRPVADELVLIQKNNLHGPTSGAYVTEKPAAEIFSDGLNAALRQNGFETTNATQYVLEGEIQGFHNRIISSGILAGQGSTTLILTVHFQLTRAGRPVWNTDFVGQDSENAMFPTGNRYGLSFAEAADDVIRQLISDRVFRSYFEP
jgi:hypothetical protein